MKFELEPDNRNVSDEDLINDLIRVAQELGQSTVLRNKYNKLGRFHSSTLERRLGSWNDALRKAGLEITVNREVTDAAILDDLRRAAQLLGKATLGYDEYTTRGDYHSSTITNRFGTWNKALTLAGLEIQRSTNNSEEDLLENIEVVWRSLGRQPRRHEMDEPPSRFSSSTYRNRFHGWRQALERFVETVNQNIPEPEVGGTTPVVNDSEIVRIAGNKSQSYRHSTNRNPNWRLRFLVLRRDNYKCLSCGRSPSTHPNVILEVDHIQAWSKDGETVIENLHTLCQKCNGGKSNLDFREPSVE